MVRALVVDDHASNRALLERLLRALGISEIHSAATATGLTDVVGAFDPDVVFLDLHVGATSGLDALAELARVDPRFAERAVVVVTGDGDPVAHRRARELGAAAVVMKPFDLAHLRSELGRVLERTADHTNGASATHSVDLASRNPQRAGAARDRPAPDFRALFEGAPGCYLVLDPQLVIVAVSDAYLAATMTERTAILGRPLFEVFPDNPDDADATGVGNLGASLTRVRELLVPDAMAVQQYDIRRPESEGGAWEVRYWSPVNSPVLGSDGRLAYIIHRVEDVSEFVRLSEHEVEREQATAELRQRTSQMEVEVLRRSRQLQLLNDELRAASDAKNEFLSRVSHELRTPLTGVLGFGELLAASDLDDEQSAWVRTILTSGRHLLALLNDVLDIARIEEGQLSLSVEPVSIERLLHDTLSIMEPVASTHQITLRPVRGTVDHRYVSADQQRLRQVMLNLLSNAVKYNRPGGTVDITISDDDGSIRLAVTDTGRGMTPAQVAKIFTPFERLDAALDGVEGTGLGLALSRQLVETMGGRLGVASTPDVGSTFWVELRAVEPVAIETPVPGRSDSTPRSYSGRRCILYVEDLVANVRLVEQILKRRPDVTLIPSMLGELALDLARDHQPDLVLLDLHLPDIGGAEVLRRLRDEATTRTIPVVVLSADATARQLQRLFAAGADGYLTKPIAIDEFLGVVDRYLGGAEVG